jgi:hypothetical protein
VEAASAPAPWLLHAPPWLGDGDDASRVPKRARTDRSPGLTRAEESLRKYAALMASKLNCVGSWSLFVAGERGLADISETVALLPHKAGRLLEHLRRRGASVPLHTGPWPAERIQVAAHRGSHRSAQDEVEFVSLEMMDFCAQGFWTVLPLHAALQLPNLRLSPLGVVPQRNRRSRLIVDYTYSGVNDETARLAPPEAMQFGKALKRVLTKVVHADPHYGPVMLGKIDIADGFYRIGIQAQDIPRLGVILPSTDDDPLVALPLALPMGWVESPPYFTAVTETACDLINASLRRGETLQPHHLESLAATPPSDDTPQTGAGAPRLARMGSTVPRSPPLAYADVYVDDFILVAQTKRHRTRVLRAALHSIDDVLRPLSDTDGPHRKEPVSVKKLRQGDACWATRKTILGWDFDTETETLHLPPHRLARLYVLLDAFPPTRRRAPMAEWHQLLGELRSMAAALPGARGLFSELQEALRKGDRHRVRLNRRVFDSLADFRSIADSLGQRPTRFRELVPVGDPVATGACDACQRGMGGVWFRPHQPPLVWRSEFPVALQRLLVTSKNRAGTISISDLELAGTLAHKQILVQALPTVAERPIWLGGDNRASLAWATKGSSTASTARAYLLRLGALHQRHHRYVPQHDYVPGKFNVMADDASRRWDLSNQALLTHFNSLYPQATSWQLLTLQHEMYSAVIGALSRQRSIPANLHIARTRPLPPGSFGSNSVLAPASEPICTTCLATRSPSCCSSPTSIALAASHPAPGPSGLERWRTPSAMWRRRSPGWGPLTLG